MLSVSSYPQGYIDARRALGSAIDQFEPLFLNNMVLVLDQCFVHRSRTTELKDGNPLNEVRVLCDSILRNDGLLAADKTIKLEPATSVLGYEVGDRIRLDQTAFSRLADGFFAEIEAKYAEG